MMKNVMVQLNEEDYNRLNALILAFSNKYKGNVTRSAYLRYLIRDAKMETVE